MVYPANPALFGTLPPPAPVCGMDRHVGPFEPLGELASFLGTDWFCCRACRATVTRRNVRGALVPA
ncbi:MAG TPA: hypothetical protein VGC13_00370 [Longimicrobium sp.]|jgi:hypothetical protein|uniref:hypothetical protein n=1 Tax=Longimicrobium sp. TaxID=2029185 RepID=UPI002ED956F6